MLSRLSVFIGVLSLLAILSPSAQAKNAELLLSPTRVVLDKGAKYATVTVRNNGDGTGRYKIDTLDSVMQENGVVKMMEGGEKSPHSILDYISLSPKSMTLKPDENQPLRILVKNMDALPDGEYRSHIRVKVDEPDLDSITAPTPTDGKGAVISMKTKMTMIIPVIIRKGETSYKVSLDDASVALAGGKGETKPSVLLKLSYEGNRSANLDVKVTHVAPDGKQSELAFFRGLTIYREVTKREHQVPLDVPQGLNLKNGTLHVVLMSQENEGKQVLASKDIKG